MKSSPIPDITSKKQFRTELIELCKRHGVSIGEIEYRDNDENYTGSNFYFKGDNIDSVELSDLMGELNLPVKKWRITSDAPLLPVESPRKPSGLLPLPTPFADLDYVTKALSAPLLPKESDHGPSL